MLTGLWPDNVSVYIFTQPHPHKKKNKKFHDFIDLQVSCTVRKRIYPYASTIGTIFTLHNFILDFHFEDYLNSQEIAYEECKVSSTDIDSYGLCEEW